MYNSNISDTQTLPSSGQLIRSTIIALIASLVILVTVVMPAEYAIDPIGIGRVLGLTEMGEIKEQLAEEALADAKLDAEANNTPLSVAPAKPSESAPVAQLHAAQNNPVVVVEAPQAPSAQPQVAAEPLPSHTVSFRLKPGQPAEIKLEMLKDAEVKFSWTANGGKVNFDTHGDPFNAPKGFYHGYGKGRFQPSDQGVLKAAFDGKHGWFWRNRTKEEVKITLNVEGDYAFLERVL
ncbi:hypothetical protein [Neptuniibacter caesariensis]|uniref:Transmembrane anchor protein n=1 Tax=Neptuniibacter caesariensis TaxID=207954 RepID=A0A7U8C6T8_NEPCE|nr:hypothetical protein [Neptuniibacter caesariensis]EAR62588.1 hypothetical protein MED92_05703 [Oceanospirillum sp. MED92] [Neptuniibacter caesariensis]